MRRITFTTSYSYGRYAKTIIKQNNQKVLRKPLQRKIEKSARERRMKSGTGKRNSGQIVDNAF